MIHLILSSVYRINFFLSFPACAVPLARKSRVSDPRHLETSHNRVTRADRRKKFAVRFLSAKDATLPIALSTRFLFDFLPRPGNLRSFFDIDWKDGKIVRAPCYLFPQRLKEEPLLLREAGRFAKIPSSVTLSSRRVLRSVRDAATSRRRAKESSSCFRVVSVREIRNDHGDSLLLSHTLLYLNPYSARLSFEGPPRITVLR